MKEQIGPTGQGPHGKINESDRGEVRMALLFDPKRTRVVIDFGGNVSWIGLGVEEARDLARMLLRQADIVAGEWDFARDEHPCEQTIEEASEIRDSKKGDRP